MAKKKKVVAKKVVASTSVPNAEVTRLKAELEEAKAAAGAAEKMTKRLAEQVMALQAQNQALEEQLGFYRANAKVRV